MDALTPEFEFRIVAPAQTTAHLVGVNEPCMQGLARWLIRRGWQVNCTDQSSSASRAGWPVGVAARFGPDDADLVVYSAATAADHPERRRAEQQGIETISYAQMLGRMMAETPSVAIAGSHGTATTAAMVGEIMKAAGLKSSVALSAAPMVGDLAEPEGDADLFVAELGECGAEIQDLWPKFAAILDIEINGIEADGDSDELVDRYASFASNVAPAGFLAVRADSTLAAAVARHADCQVKTFGIDRDADWHPRQIVAHNGFYEFELWFGDDSLGPVKLRIPGKHQILCALAAASLAMAAGVSRESILAGLQRFAGLQRHLELAGMPRGVNWIDDISQHPAEVAATLGTLREMLPISRIWCLFQQDGRRQTAEQFDRLAQSLTLADRVAIVDSAQQPCKTETDPAQSGELAQRVSLHGGRVREESSAADIQNWLTKAIEVGELTRGDIIITMGTVEVGQIGAGLSKTFSTRRLAG